ncbi:MAG: histone deacetylase [Firmicutes bacterium]|nr:histone deacetylase [Bacillota bacterium]
MKAGIVYHPDYLKHDTGDHVENPRRLTAIYEALRKSGFLEKIIEIKPRLADDEELQLVHPADYIKALEAACKQGGGWLDSDTYASPLSATVARLAAGGALKAVESVMDEGYSWVFGLLRPPGHHALSSKAMGFCLYNNIAIAARFALKKYKLKKVLIVDWDVHHGNGTQDIFYNDPSVFYFSVHQSPLYPGTGKIDENGSGAGKNFNLNVPLPPGSGDGEYLKVFNEILYPAAVKYEPELVLISAGFDGHIKDPLAQMRITTEGFSAIAGVAKKIADDTPARGRMVALLEGGYNLQALPESVVAVMQKWL